MPETLVIRLPDSPATAAEWVVVNADGTLRSPVAGGALVETLELAEGRKVIGLAPAAAVLRTAVIIPLKNPNKIRQALPFALEEYLASDVDEQHFACGQRDPAGQVEVAVVTHERVEAWLGAITAVGIRLDGLYAESDALPALPSTLTVLVGTDRIIIRDAAGVITVADHDSLQATLELLMSQDQVPPPPDEQQSDGPALAKDDVTEDLAGDAPTATATVGPAELGAAEMKTGPVNLLVYAHPDVHERHAMLWEMLRLRVASLDVKLVEDDGLARLAGEIVNSGGVNLLQGVYAPKTEIAIHWPQWRIAALLLVGFTTLFMVRQGVDLWQLSREEQRLDTAAEQLLLASFRDARETDNAWPELRSRLGVVQANELVINGPGFAEGIAAVAGAFSGTPDIEMEALSYRDGKLDLQLLAPNVASLDQLRQRIAEPGEFAAEIQSANPDDDKIKGRIKIEAAGGA